MRNGVLIEPLIYWADEASIYHQRMIDPALFEKLPKHAHSAERNALVDELRSKLKTLFTEYGCANLQIGKSYPYVENLVQPTRDMLQRIKTAVDPDRLMNPGSLGLQ